MSQIVNTALILAAGMGTRMLPVTGAMPKCMVGIKKTTFIANALKVLLQVGVKRVVVVVGYKAYVLMDYLKGLNLDLEVCFVHNTVYDSTNSMYSLMLGMELIDSSFWLLEGDIFFRKDLFPKHLPNVALLWLGDSHYKSSGGSFLEADSGNRLHKVSILKSPDEWKKGLLKSVGVSFISNNGVPLVYQWMKRAVDEGKSNLYYDVIWNEHLSEAKVYVHDVYPSKWAEIDTLEELSRAERFL